MEWLDLVDENGEPTGERVTREEAHAKGLRHRTAHVWLARRLGNRVQILLQKRSENKDSHPGCYDISSAGHIPAGVDFIPSALRELKEELGYTARPEQLILCGQRRVCVDDVFHGKPFHDRQVSRVYLIWVEDEPTFTLQTEEVSAVRWIDLDDCLRAVSENSFPHCISLEELHLLEAKLRT